MLREDDENSVVLYKSLEPRHHGRLSQIRVIGFLFHVLPTLDLDLLGIICVCGLCVCVCDCVTQCTRCVDEGFTRLQKHAPKHTKQTKRFLKN